MTPLPQGVGSLYAVLGSPVYCLLYCLCERNVTVLAHYLANEQSYLFIKPIKLKFLSLKSRQDSVHTVYYDRFNVPPSASLGWTLNVLQMCSSVKVMPNLFLICRTVKLYPRELWHSRRCTAPVSPPDGALSLKETPVLHAMERSCCYTNMS